MRLSQIASVETRLTEFQHGPIVMLPFQTRPVATVLKPELLDRPREGTANTPIETSPQLIDR